MGQLSARNLAKSYRNHAVVQDVSMDVQRGEVVGLLGPNGAGKSTTFHMIAGLVRPDAGDIYLDEVCITTLPVHVRARRGIGYLPQEPSIFRELTVEDNIMAILEFSAVPKHARFTRMNNLLRDFDLLTIRKKKGSILSGGQRRRVEIARALTIDMRFLLLDEPFSGIDPLAIEEMRTLILRLKSQQMGVLVTDHNVRATFSIVDRAYLIFEGKLFASGAPEELATHTEVRRLYLGENF